MRSIGEDGALIEREVRVGVPQNQCRDAPGFQFLAEAACEGERNVFFRELGSQRSTAVIASVTGVEDCVEMLGARRHDRGGSTLGGRAGGLGRARLRNLWWRLRCALLRCRGNRDGAAL